MAVWSVLEAPLGEVEPDESVLGEAVASEVESAALAADEARCVSLGRSESGQPRLDATLAPVAGTAVLNELARIEAELFKADWEAAKTVHGTATRFEHLTRSAVQRRADALVEMACRSEAASPGAVSRRPLVSVLVGFDAVRPQGAAVHRCRASGSRDPRPPLHPVGV